MMMSRMGDEFPQCPRVHVDWEFTLVDKVTQEIKNRKKFRVLAIQNNTQNYQHAAIIITELGQEYVQIPSMIKKFFSEIPKTVEVITRDHFEERENTIEELDENFRSHFENTGHDTYFFMDEGDKRVERSVS